MGRSFRALPLTKYHHLTGPWIDGFSHFNFTIKILQYDIYILYIYISIYTSERERERERDIYIYICIYNYIYIGYRICVAARIFVWNEEITFLNMLGGFSSHAMASWCIMVECQRVPLLFCPIVLLLPCEHVPDHRSRSENTERGGGGTAVPGRRVPQQVTGLWSQNRGTVT